MRNFLFLFAIVILFTSESCSDKSHVYQYNNYFTSAEIDSIMFDAVMIMGRRPKNTTREASLLPEHRPYYTNLVNDFSLKHIATNNDSIYYYFMLRPARNHTGWVNRGVGGYFSLNEEKRISGFVEVFNTPIMPKEEILHVGTELFEEMVKTGNIDKYLYRKEMIEWPDQRTEYDKSINEWVYIAD